MKHVKPSVPTKLLNANVHLDDFMITKDCPEKYATVPETKHKMTVRSSTISKTATFIVFIEYFRLTE